MLPLAVPALSVRHSVIGTRISYTRTDTTRAEFSLVASLLAPPLPIHTRYVAGRVYV